MAIFRRNSNPDAPRIPRKDRRGINPVLAAAIVLAVICVGVFFGFTKKVPFTHGFRVNAVFETANSVRANSPVRIAGVNVGKVTAIKRYKDTDAALVTLELNDRALPIHKDATVKIRPRIFLEGNFFVDLRPGTPSSPTIGDGDTIPITQTSAPVQVGDVLTSLQADTRQDLKDVLKGFGGALTRKPSAADDAQADPDTRGETAAQSLNDNFDHAGPALRDASIVNEAFLGLQPDDLGGIVDNLARVTGALGRNERQLQDFVTNFNATMKIFADESSNLQASIRELSPTLRVTNRTLGHLNSSFPATRAFAREILPGVRETPATIDASFPWIDQTRKLLQPQELQGVARELSPATRDLAKTIDGAVSLLPQQDLIAKCFSKVILPAGDIVIDEGDLSTGKENYKEFWYTLVGLAGEGSNFDGNGSYVRFQAGGGSQMISTGESSLSGETLFGRNDQKPLGNRPAYPGKRPPYRPDVPCYTQKIPDFNGAATSKPDKSTEEAPPTLGAGSAGSLTGGLGGVSVPVPGTPGVTLPPLDPQLPNPVGSARSKSSGASSPAPAAAAPKDDVAAELLDRLNPFRTGGGR